MSETLSHDEARRHILAHHEAMRQEVARLADLLVRQAAEGGEAWRGTREALVAYCEGEVFPHAAAEEETLYAEASRAAALGPLVAAMEEEHRTLEGVARDLKACTDPTRAAALATALSLTFGLHVAKENDHLLPAGGAIALGQVLKAMTEAFHRHQAQREAALSQDAAAPPEDVVTLDVRTIPHRDRHPIIFRILEHLTPPRRLVLLVDHNPLPLRYQIEAGFAGRFSWRYLADGPDLWQVEIAPRADA